MEEITKADELHAQGQYIESFNYLLEQSKKPEFKDNAQINWRLARGYFNSAEAAKDTNQKKDLVLKGKEISDLAVQQDPKSADANKWAGIMLSAVGDYASTKEKIGNAFKVKEYALKAYELNPSDSNTLFMLGKWCYEVTNIGWLERKVASAVFASPPESTYQEAVSWYLKAHDAQPNNIRNALALGDAYAAMKDTTNANLWYKRCAEMPALEETDKARTIEAKNKIK